MEVGGRIGGDHPRDWSDAHILGHVGVVVVFDCRDDHVVVAVEVIQRGGCRQGRVTVVELVGDDLTDVVRDSHVGWTFASRRLQRRVLVVVHFIVVIDIIIFVVRS